MSGNQPYKNRKCILIVDDDFINREILKNIFSSTYCIEEAENGLEGLQKIEDHQDRLCVILLDVKMPVMDGMELLKHLRDRGILNQIPVFLITASDEQDVAEAAYNMGVMGIINKPIVPIIATRRVEIATELFQARDALAERVEHQEKILQENVETIDALHRNTLEVLASTIEFRDIESGEHTNRIYDITKTILQNTEMGAGFTPEEIENMAIGSIMHDVGKIAISDIILNKPGKLTKEEFEAMKSHTIKGAALMAKLNKLQNHPSYEYAWDIARHHHERWDGHGYPDGLKGDEITVWSQVTAIADVYDALVSSRVYKKAYSMDTAMEMILGGECGEFNPKLLQCFRQVEPQLRKIYVQEKDVHREAEGAVEVNHDLEAEEKRELIDILLLTAAVKSAYDMIICVNLTQNSYYMMDYDRFLTHCADADGVFDDLIEAGAQSIPPSHRQQFLDAFSRENLLKAQAAGKKSVTLEHPQYTDDGKVVEVSTSVLFMEDPRNGDIREITLARYRGG